MKSNNHTLVEHHHQIVNAIIMCSSIDRVMKPVLAALATTFNLNDECSKQTRAYIASIAQCSKSTITRIIALAESQGILIRTPQFKQIEGESAPRQIANKYEFNLSLLGLRLSRKERKERAESRRKAAMMKQREQKHAKKSAKATDPQKKQPTNDPSLSHTKTTDNGSIQGFELFQQMKKKLHFSGT